MRRNTIIRMRSGNPKQLLAMLFSFFPKQYIVKLAQLGIARLNLTIPINVINLQKTSLLMAAYRQQTTV